MTRKYSAKELRAFRAVGFSEPENDGPAQYARGPYWADELDRRADAAEKSVPNLRLAAAALRREIEAEQVGGS